MIVNFSFFYIHPDEERAFDTGELQVGAAGLPTFGIEEGDERGIEAVEIDPGGEGEGLQSLGNHEAHQVRIAIEEKGVLPLPTSGDPARALDFSVDEGAECRMVFQAVRLLGITSERVVEDEVGVLLDDLMPLFPAEAVDDGLAWEETLIWFACGGEVAFADSNGFADSEELEDFGGSGVFFVFLLAFE
jgi:hypothetical protein